MRLKRISDGKRTKRIAHAPFLGERIAQPGAGEPARDPPREASTLDERAWFSDTPHTVAFNLFYP